MVVERVSFTASDGEARFPGCADVVALGRSHSLWESRFWDKRVNDAALAKRDFVVVGRWLDGLDWLATSSGGFSIHGVGNGVPS